MHKARETPGFTKTYGVDLLVWFEAYGSRDDAFRRERRIKDWRRSWKLMLIEAGNPDWRDLADEINDQLPFRFGAPVH